MTERTQKTESADIRRITTPPGGIMTDEVGAITGAVEVWLDEGSAKIRYEGALDTYTVTGDANCQTVDEVAAVLTTDPGLDGYGNPAAVSLQED